MHWMRNRKPRDKYWSHRVMETSNALDLEPGVDFVTGEAIVLMAPRIGTRAACEAAGVPQATWYRLHRISPPVSKAAVNV